MPLATLTYQVPADLVEAVGRAVNEVLSCLPETATKQRENVPSQHEVRPWCTRMGIEQQCDTLGVTAGETATQFHRGELRAADAPYGERKPEAPPMDGARKGPSGTAATDPSADRVSANTGGDHVACNTPNPPNKVAAPDQSVAATPSRHAPLRPFCQRPELCGGYGKKHCGTCERAAGAQAA